MYAAGWSRHAAAAHGVAWRGMAWHAGAGVPQAPHPRHPAPPSACPPTAASLGGMAGAFYATNVGATRPMGLEGWRFAFLLVSAAVASGTLHALVVWHDCVPRPARSPAPSLPTGGGHFCGHRRASVPLCGGPPPPGAPPLAARRHRRPAPPRQWHGQQRSGGRPSGGGCGGAAGGAALSGAAHVAAGA